MASQFCMSCGKPMPADARFCAACGTPTSAGAPPSAAPAPSAAPTAAPPATPPAPVAPAPAGGGDAPLPSLPPLGQVLGLDGARQFLLQHQLLSNGRNYRVLNHEKKHLFTVKEDVRQELEANILHRPRPAATEGFTVHVGFQQAPPVSLFWTVADASGTPQGKIAIQVAGNNIESTLSDANGTPVLAVSVHRSALGGLTATAAFPDGRAMYQTHGNLLRHNFAIQDPTGKEVAKVHEAWASVRDTYNLDLVGEVDPLCPLILAILIDREKAS